MGRAAREAGWVERLYQFLRRNHKNYNNLSKHGTFLLLNLCVCVRLLFLIMCERILSEWVELSTTKIFLTLRFFTKHSLRVLPHSTHHRVDD